MIVNLDYMYLLVAHLDQEGRPATRPGDTARSWVPGRDRPERVTCSTSDTITARTRSRLWSSPRKGLNCTVP